MNVSTILRGGPMAVALTASLAGCAGGQTGSALPPQATAPMPPSAMGDAAQPDRAATMFTANRDNPAVLAFRATASGNVAPVVRITGSNTTLNSPDSIALDASGNVYVANDGANQVAVFAKGANGNVKPERIIGGSKSQLGPTEGLLVDGYGKLWASDYGNNAITAYPKGASGNVKPATVISGGNTQLSTPTGMVWGTYGSSYVVYVANTGGASVVGFNPAAKGNVAPVVSIAGSNTGLSRPFALAVDSTGRLLVADESAGILVFSPGANGNVAPVAHITGLTYPAGVVTDGQDNIYVANFSGESIEEFLPNANGNATPLRTIRGRKTTLKGPNYLVLR
ncbi:MAG TPA: NHL repeat-containing protein [Candidatus Binatia bacterium]|nr:NHL repeat-containing protein [Candidatus Binatia bacterium]